MNARVTEILINDENKSAYGVRFLKDKKTYSVNATKEILLCAGVFNSPQILMLSGIGPKDHLEELGKVKSSIVLCKFQLLLILMYKCKKSKKFLN